MKGLSIGFPGLLKSSCTRAWYALRPFLQDVLEHGLIQREIGHDLFRTAILLLELLDPPQLGHPHPGVGLLPVVERRLGPSKANRRKGVSVVTITHHCLTTSQVLWDPLVDKQPDLSGRLNHRLYVPTTEDSPR